MYYYLGVSNMYKRNEPFRFEFTKPISCFFTILTPQNTTKESNKGEIKMHNLSQKGCNFTSQLNLPADSKWYLTIELTINETPMLLSGHIVWKKHYSTPNYMYGFQFDQDHDYSKLITAEVKEFAANERRKAKLSSADI